MNEAEFQQLIKDAKSGNEAPFKRFFIRCHKACMEQLLRLTKSEEDAEDVFMEAMYRFWKRLQSGEMAYQSNLSGYIFITAKNLWLEGKRKKASKTTDYLTEENVRKYLAQAINISDEEAFNPLLRAETEQHLTEAQAKRVNALVRAFKLLGEKCRRLLKGSIVYKIRMDELQKELGYASYNAVKVAKHQCKKSFIKKFNTELAMS